MVMIFDWPLENLSAGYKAESWDRTDDFWVWKQYYSGGKGGFHWGQDVQAPLWTNILNTGPGRVALLDDNPDGDEGRMIGVRDAMTGLLIVHMHCAEFLVELGDVLPTARQRIARVGVTGQSFGPHDHIEAAQPGVPYAHNISRAEYFARWRNPRVNLFPFLLDAHRARRWRTAA